MLSVQFSILINLLPVVTDKFDCRVYCHVNYVKYYIGFVFICYPLNYLWFLLYKIDSNTV